MEAVVKYALSTSSGRVLRICPVWMLEIWPIVGRQRQQTHMLLAILPSNIYESLTRHSLQQYSENLCVHAPTHLGLAFDLQHAPGHELRRRRYRVAGLSWCDSQKFIKIVRFEVQHLGLIRANASRSSYDTHSYPSKETLNLSCI